MSTIKDVAKHAGVSTATVSRALSQPEKVQEETRERVKRAALKLGYAPNVAAKNLRTLRSSRIVVMVPGISNPFFSEVLQGIEETARDAAYSVILVDLRDDVRRENDCASMLLRKEADGLIFLGDHVPAPLAPLVAQQKMRAPIVSACDYSKNFGVAGVHIDNSKASFEALSLLYSLGHSRIGVITGPQGSNLTKARLQGVRRAAAQQGAGAELTIRTANYDVATGATEATALLAAPERPTAIFCFSDELAIGAVSACRSLGLVCPADVSIIGFDDIRYARYVDPALTTIRQPMRKLGSEAMKLLLGKLNGSGVETREITLPHELVVRASTGPARRK
jgi:LacI family repressor for deo operon, udp, cdd, tsx, nupC, and nupG